MIDGLVSVIMAAYQAEAFLDEALQSAFAQDYSPVEVIVVDDGSTDGTVALASQYPVTLLRAPHGGPAAARNIALERAQGEFVTILDADDLWPTDRLSAQVGCLAEHPEADIVVGLSQIFVTPGHAIPPHFPAHLDGPVAGHMAALLARRSVFDAVGGYDESLRLCEDIDWFMRARDAGVQVHSLDHLVLRYRIHTGNTSRHIERNRAVLLRVLRDSVARRRAHLQ